MTNKKKISKKDIEELLKEWSRRSTIFVPSRDKGVVEMTKWDGRDTDFLKWFRNTVIPPKALFLPSSEKMFGFQKSGDGYHLELPTEPQRQLLFGIRPCDARALTIIDKVFTDLYEDPYYVPKRNNTALIGLSCIEPYDSCYCTSLGVEPTESADVDLMFIDIGDEFLVEEVTEKGKGLLAEAGVSKKATKADEAKANTLKAVVAGKMTRRLDIKDIGERLRACFDSKDRWEKISAKCISCGICTFLCPTCHCFDICDESANKRGARYRCWDSCSFKLYTKMPMENPREEKWRRVRQRIFHKYEFYPMSFGVIACTGCGRCIRQCPVNWDIVLMLNDLPASVAPGGGR